MKTKGKFILLEGISGCGKSTLAKLLVKYLRKLGIDAVLNAEPTKTNVFGRAVRKIIEGNELQPELLEELRADTAFLSATLGISISRVSELRQKKIIEFCRSLDRIWMKLEFGRELTELERQMIFIADRAVDVPTTIIPAIMNGKWVIEDRYDLSNYAYGTAHGVLFDELYDLHETALGKHYLIPDITFVIDVTARVAVNRLRKSGKPIDLHEGLESLGMIRAQYNKATMALAAKLAKVHTHYRMVRINGKQSVPRAFAEMKEWLENQEILPTQ
ncbi:MAG: hypothetical protein AAB920_03725 [Patescibacteria group bacterium]